MLRDLGFTGRFQVCTARRIFNYKRPKVVRLVHVCTKLKIKNSFVHSNSHRPDEGALRRPRRPEFKPKRTLHPLRKFFSKLKTTLYPLRRFIHIRNQPFKSFESFSPLDPKSTLWKLRRNQIFEGCRSLPPKTPAKIVKDKIQLHHESTVASLKSSCIMWIQWKLHRR
jgi:hypothetical protein